MTSTRRRDAWLRHPIGARFLAAEREHLAAILPDLFGYYLLQVGGWGRHTNLCDQSRIRHRFVLDLPGGDADLLADPEAWPILSDSVDVVVLPHTLELVSDPHRVLREAERVLIGEGHLVVLGFSPWSLWRLSKPPGKAFVSEGRLRDWVGLLGFDVRRVTHHSPKLPGGAYVLLARKRVIGMTPIRSRWQAQRRFQTALGPSR